MAHLDNRNAINELGFLYYFNPKFKDFDKTKFWFEKVVNVKSTVAMFWIGCLNLEETAIFKNKKKVLIGLKSLEI